MSDSEAGNLEPGHDGLYAVMFNNRPGYPESKIREEFEKFGSIKKCRLLDTGAGFIRYADREEAVNCLKEMSAHPVYRAKVPSNRNFFRSQNQGGGDRPNNRGGRYSQGRESSNNSKSNNFFNNHEEVQNLSSISDNIGGRYSQGREPNNNSKSNNSFSNHEEVQHLSSISETAAKSKSHPAGDQPPELKQYANFTWEKELAQLPEVEAVEVIVANLPSGVYQSELYEMCAVGQPIHIDVHQSEQPVSIYFASVYVKTVKHANYLIEELNDVFIENNKLVVALASTMWDAYSSDKA